MLRLIRQAVNNTHLHASREEVLEAQALIQARLAFKHGLASQKDLDLICAAVIANAITSN
jgi:hypothetical protein